MVKALAQAKKAAEVGEVPIGVVIVKDNIVIARAYNKRNQSKNALHHAEMLAIEKACKKLKDWRLEGCDMFVTLMPCPMCAGAIVNARIERVFFGANNQNNMLFEDILQKSELNHKAQSFGGVMERECTHVLKDFFDTLRK
jgi:tRNA(adenine34) deaminase